MPLVLKPEAKNDQTQAEDEGRRVSYDQAGFWIETAPVASKVEATHSVVKVVPG